LAIRVMVKNNEPLEKTLRRLRKICNNEGITRDLKRSAYYEKPSERRRRKERERIKNLRKADRPEKEKKDKKKDKDDKKKEGMRKEPRL
jgi:small subunit ribosomal protein S21